MSGWQVIAAPLDCAAAGEGEERAPAALMEVEGEDFARQAPLILDTRLTSPERDPASGVIAIDDLKGATAKIQAAVQATVARGDRPLLLGGDCAVLLGALTAAKSASPDLRLLYLDGHPDACDGTTSPTGEAADMTLAALTTDRIPELLPEGQDPPIVSAQRVALVGHRGDAPADIELADGSRVTEESLLPDALQRINAAELGAAGPDRVAAEALESIGARSNPLWLALDLDILDESEMPAVSYPQSGGPSARDVSALLRAVAERADVVGFSVTCFNPDLDPDGSAARLARSLVAGALGRFAV